MKMIDRAGAVHEIPDDRVQEAFQSKKYGFLEGDTVPVITADGAAGRVRAEDAGDAFAQQARIALPEEIKHAERQEKYGSGFGNAAAATAEGFGRGLSGGFLDPIAIGLAKHLISKDAGEAVREHLAGEKEARPGLSATGEVIGTAVPFLVPGGAAVEGASLAARGAEGAALAGKVAEGAGAVGKAAEGAEALAGAAKAGEAGGEVLAGGKGTIPGGWRPDQYVSGAAPTATETANEAANAARSTTGAASAATDAEGAAADAAAAVKEATVAPEDARAAAAAMGDPSRAAQVARGLGEAIRTAGAVPRAIGAAGNLAERAVAAVVGKEAGNAAGRAAQKIIARAGGVAAEGALFGIGNEIDEAALGDHELNAESLRAAAGHGAIMGFVMGGVLTGAGELAREVAGRSSPMFRKLAGRAAWKAANPTKGFSEKALIRAGGAEAVGQTIIDRGVLDSASNVEELYANTNREVLKAGAELGEIYNSNAGAVTRKQLADIWDGKIAELRKKALHGHVVRALEEAKADFLDKLTPRVDTEVAEKVAATVRPSLELTPEEVAKFKADGVLGGNSQAAHAKMEAAGIEFGPDLRLRFKEAPKVPAGDPQEAIKKIADDTPIPIRDVIAQRQAIGDMAYKEAKQLDPKARVEQLREIYGQLADLENTAMDRANRLMGEGPNKAQIERARKDYQHLSLYKEALQKSNARYATNRSISLSDYLVAAGSVAAGHPLIGAAQALGNKVLRERGSAWTARYLDKLATLSAIERASSTVGRDVDRGVAGFFRPGERSAPRVRIRTYGHGKDEYQGRVDTVANAAAHPDAHADHVEEISRAIADHAPQTANSFRKSTLAVTAYLASKIPSGHQPITNSLTPNLEKPRVSETEKLEYKRTVDMAHDPVGSTFDRLNRGMLTKSDVDAMGAMYPKILDQIRRKAIDELSSQKTTLPFVKRMQMGTLLGLPADQALAPLFVHAMQQTYADDSDQPPAGHEKKAGSGAPKRMLKSDSAKLAGQD